MPPRVKSEHDREKLRASILNAARDLFAERGIDAVSMREIAKRINYSATTLYHHFADKEALLQAVCDEDFLKLAAGMHEVMQLPDHIERMKAMAQGYARFALQHPNHYRLMFMIPRASNKQITRIQQGNTEQDAYAQLKYLVKQAFAAQLFREDLHDPELIAQTIWAGIHGVCSLQIALGQEDWVDWATIEARVQLMQDTLLHGLLRHSVLNNNKNIKIKTGMSNLS